MSYRNHCKHLGPRIPTNMILSQSTFLCSVLFLLSKTPSCAFVHIGTGRALFWRECVVKHPSTTARPFRRSYDSPDEGERAVRPFVLDRNGGPVADRVRPKDNAGAVEEEDAVKSWGRPSMEDDGGEEVIRTPEKSRQTSEDDFRRWASRGLGHWPFSPKLTDTKNQATGESDDDSAMPIQDKIGISAGDETITDVAARDILFDPHQQPAGLLPRNSVLNVEAFLQRAQNATAYKQMTDRMDELLSMSAMLPDLVHRAAEVVSNTSEYAVTETRESATRLLDVTDSLLVKGYVAGDPLAGKERELIEDVHEQQRKVAAATDGRHDPKALFDSFGITAVELNDWTPSLERASRFARLAAAIYSPEEEMVAQVSAEGESLVAKGTTANVKWAISDSLIEDDTTEAVGGKPKMIRTLTIRGYDASDESVDRKDLFYTICDALAVPLGTAKTDPQIMVHRGLYEVAQALYGDVRHLLVDWLSPDTKIVIGGHSIGGALSNLLLFLITMDKGVTFVSERVEHVFTFGAPPVAVVKPIQKTRTKSKTQEVIKTAVRAEQDFDCAVLSALKLPPSMVSGYVQPWDPIVRLFSECDPLYPLVGEIDIENGDDGMLLWPRGPPRVLRQVTGKIIEAWGEGWPEFRDEFRKNSNQTYTATGIQHLLLPEPKRYLTDRFLSVDVAVPPVATILRLGPHHLFPAVTKAFPLTTFEISFVPEAIRSFLHHFFPAYSDSLVGFVDQLRSGKEVVEAEENLNSHGDDDAEEPCYILDMDNDETAAIIMKALQKTPYSPSVSTVLSTLATASTDDDATTVVSLKRPSTGKKRQRYPWKRATAWLRRRKDLTP